MDEAATSRLFVAAAESCGNFGLSLRCKANVRYMANAMGPEGVRVNAISAGPIRTLAASGIKDFRKMLAHCEAVTPIRRTVTIEDVGNSAAFLCSDLSAGISGEVVHVDGGFSIAAMNELELK